MPSQFKWNSNPSPSDVFNVDVDLGFWVSDHTQQCFLTVSLKDQVNIKIHSQFLEYLRIGRVAQLPPRSLHHLCTAFCSPMKYPGKENQSERLEHTIDEVYGTGGCTAIFSWEH